MREPFYIPHRTLPGRDWVLGTILSNYALSRFFKSRLVKHLTIKVDLKKDSPPVVGDNLHVVRRPCVEAVYGDGAPEVRPRLVWSAHHRRQDSSVLLQKGPQRVLVVQMRFSINVEEYITFIFYAIFPANKEQKFSHRKSIRVIHYFKAILSSDILVDYRNQHVYCPVSKR